MTILTIIGFLVSKNISILFLPFYSIYILLFVFIIESWITA